MQPLLLDLVKKSADYLAAHGVTNARREAEWIFAESLALTRLDLYTRFDMPLDDAEVVRLRALVSRRGKREPLAYVLGNQEFHGLRLEVGPGVLVPRPETEELVDLVMAALPAASPASTSTSTSATATASSLAVAAPYRVLDVGTGSGAIALALKKARPDLVVEATDCSEAALAFARRNAGTAGLEIAFAIDHLARGRTGVFDAVVANLPYVGEDERADCDPELAFEPQDALFAGRDGLALIAELVADAPRLLARSATGGTLWLEHGWKQGPAIVAICARHGLACTIVKDGAGKDRFARIQVMATASSPTLAAPEPA